MTEKFPKIAESMPRVERVLALEALYTQSPRIYSLAKQVLATADDVRTEIDAIEDLDKEIALVENKLKRLEYRRACAKAMADLHQKPFNDYLAALSSKKAA